MRCDTTCLRKKRGSPGGTARIRRGRRIELICECQDNAPVHAKLAMSIGRKVNDEASSGPRSERLAQIRRASFATGSEQRQTATDSKGKELGPKRNKKQYNLE